MIKTIVAAMAALSIVATPVAAQNYVSGDVGGAFLPHSNNTSQYTVNAGHDYGKIRAEVGYNESRGVHRNEPRHATQSYHLRGYYEPYTYRGVTPYVGFGLSHGSYNSRPAYAYDVIVGGSYSVSRHYDFYAQGVNSNTPKLRNDTTYGLGFRRNF